MERLLPKALETVEETLDGAKVSQTEANMAIRVIDRVTGSVGHGEMMGNLTQVNQDNRTYIVNQTDPRAKGYIPMPGEKPREVEAERVE